MPNAFNTDKYKLHMQEQMPLFLDENLTDTKVIEVKGKSADYKIKMYLYSAKIGEYNYRGNKCFLYKDDVLHTKWECFTDSSVFYQLISHKNGREYLIFRQGARVIIMTVAKSTVKSRVLRLLPNLKTRKIERVYAKWYNYLCINNH